MLSMAAFTEMFHEHGLPVFSFTGCSDSKIFDQQASAEGALWMMLTALGGGNLIHDVGYVESALTACYEMLVGMNEIAGLVKRFMRGIDVTAETMALDLIDKVGPSGHFLAEDHTYEHFRENWVPKLLDRSTRADWESRGSLTLGDRASTEVHRILEEYHPKPLDRKVLARLDAIVNRAEDRVK
jgi:trimethylamine--corrinoid protein Co-methyltransferase